MKDRNKIVFLIAALALVGGAVLRSVSSKLELPQVPAFSRLFSLQNLRRSPTLMQENTKVVTEESVVIDVVEKVSPSVVTVGIRQDRSQRDIFEINPFDPFQPFRRREGSTEPIERDIGTGFIISDDGLVVTNRHVVSETGASYRVITQDGTTYEVNNVYRDPINDLAIVKIDASGLTPIEMGDSEDIKVGQLAIAIGTALGEFRNTVTTGVVSGVGRGIVAGDPFLGDVEELDNVIQTDAAINPGNSGGPLLNSAGQVIGVNTAVSQGGENIGFAIPINVVRDAVENFNQTGQFNRAFLGVRYRLITREIAVLNDLPEGAYVLEVVEGSSADQGGLQEGDIIMRIDGTRINEDNGGLASIISNKRVGDTIRLDIYRGDEEQTITIRLGTQNQ